VDNVAEVSHQQNCTDDKNQQQHFHRRLLICGKAGLGSALIFQLKSVNKMELVLERNPAKKEAGNNRRNDYPKSKNVLCPAHEGKHAVSRNRIPAAWLSYLAYADFILRPLS
jgi:hypothetical protein